MGFLYILLMIRNLETHRILTLRTLTLNPKPLENGENAAVPSGRTNPEQKRKFSELGSLLGSLEGRRTIMGT